MIDAIGAYLSEPQDMPRWVITWLVVSVMANSWRCGRSAERIKRLEESRS